jgi:hypothetical protein
LNGSGGAWQVGQKVEISRGAIEGGDARGRLGRGVVVVMMVVVMMMLVR